MTTSIIDLRPTFTFSVFNPMKENCRTEDEILISKRIQKDFDEYAPNLKKIYLDVLQAYNRTGAPENFINEESLEVLINNEIWPTLIRNANHKIKYEQTLSLINKDNNNWCQAKANLIPQGENI
jgi:hypothetical protein